MVVVGIIVEVLGAYRYFQQSRAIMERDPRTGNGRALGSSPFVITIGVLFGFVFCGLLVLVLVAS